MSVDVLDCDIRDYSIDSIHIDSREQLLRNQNLTTVSGTHYHARLRDRLNKATESILCDLKTTGQAYHRQYRDSVRRE